MISNYKMYLAVPFIIPATLYIMPPSKNPLHDHRLAAPLLNLVIEEVERGCMHCTQLMHRALAESLKNRNKAGKDDPKAT